MNSKPKKFPVFAIAMVALVLKDENAKDFRVPQGDIVELNERQYDEVSAYVTLVKPDNAKAQALAAEEKDGGEEPEKAIEDVKPAVAAKAGKKAGEQG